MLLKFAEIGVRPELVKNSNLDQALQRVHVFLLDDLDRVLRVLLDVERSHHLAEGPLAEERVDFVLFSFGREDRPLLVTWRHDERCLVHRWLDYLGCQHRLHLSLSLVQLEQLGF